MTNLPTNIENILSNQVSGFHQYILNEPVHLSYVSQNFCDMTGFDQSELMDDSKDMYASLVHPSDRDTYYKFISSLAEKEQTLDSRYRIVKKDGSVIYVKDTASSNRLSDGTLTASCVLSDITDIITENGNLQFLNETIPCGFMKYTCEKQPRVTYINQKMIDILRFCETKEGELDYLEMCKSNIFLMIPMEERRRFSKYLNRVYNAGSPLAGEMMLLRADGTRAYVFGWVTKCVNEQGAEEFQSVCMDITERHHIRKSAETQRYMKALTDVYDKIFEFNIETNTVKCLHCDNDSTFKKFEDIPMQIEDALEKWILSAVDKSEHEKVRSFFKAFSQKKLYEPEARPPQITYSARSSSGEIKRYSGIFIKVDDSVSFYCCRHLQDTSREDILRTQNDQLKKKMQDLVMQFSDGIAAFEVSADSMVKPLYASENVCEFFGYTKEEWLPFTQTYTPLDQFVANSDVAYEDFAQLLRTGEAEYTYYDCTSDSERKIKAICTQKEPDNTCPRYVMLYSVENSFKGQGDTHTERSVAIRTFGYFDVFVENKPIAFRNKKSKELLALLVDRRGGYVTSEEAIGFLWEDESANTVTMSRYRKVALRLKNTLEEYGISDIVETVDGKRRIVMEKVRCDLYDYLSGKEEYAQLFKGSYLTNYSWGENTLGELTLNAE